MGLCVGFHLSFLKQEFNVRIRQVSESQSLSTYNLFQVYEINYNFSNFRYFA